MTETDKPHLTRVTVNLLPRAHEALNAIGQRDGDSKTDAINRAIQLYDLVSRHAAQGGTVLLRHKNGDVESVRLI